MTTLVLLFLEIKLFPSNMLTMLKEILLLWSFLLTVILEAIRSYLLPFLLTKNSIRDNGIGSTLLTAKPYNNSACMSFWKVEKSNSEK